mgnify:CR=1 FL=1
MEEALRCRNWLRKFNCLSIASELDQRNIHDNCILIGIQGFSSDTYLIFKLSSEITVCTEYLLIYSFMIRRIYCMLTLKLARKSAWKKPEFGVRFLRDAAGLKHRKVSRQILMRVFYLSCRYCCMKSLGIAAGAIGTKIFKNFAVVQTRRTASSAAIAT